MPRRTKEEKRDSNEKEELPRDGKLFSVCPCLICPSLWIRLANKSWPQAILEVSCSTFSLEAG